MTRVFSLSELALAMEKGDAELFIVLDGMKFKVSYLPDRGGQFGQRYWLTADRVVEPVPEPETVYVAESEEVETGGEPEPDEPAAYVPRRSRYNKK